jgi:hypothetical protein
VPPGKHISRGLRFTLTSVYTLLFTLLLGGVSLLFYHSLASNLEEQAYDDLNQRWAVVLSNLRIENDPGQAFIWWPTRTASPCRTEMVCPPSRLRGLVR